MSGERRRADLTNSSKYQIITVIRGNVAWIGEEAMPESAAPQPSSRRSVGRPPRPMPERIPDTPENVARTIFSGPPKPKSEWRYLRRPPASG